MSKTRTFEIPLTFKQWKAIRDLIKGDAEPTGEQAVALANTMSTIDGHLERMEEIDKKSKLFIVRLFDGFDNVWMDITKPVSKEEAERVWNKKTRNGTEKTKFGDIDYYKIFPADTRMSLS